MRAWRKGPPSTIEENIAATILATIAVSASFSVVAAAGAAAFFLGAGATGYLFWRRDFNREIKRLQKRGYVALTKTEDGWLVRITKTGKRQAKRIQIKHLVLPRPKVWDGKWRMFVFDVPEKYRYARDAMRMKMKALGLYNIQRSVLVYPHDCREELELIAEYFLLDKYCTYVETNFIDIDKQLRRHFGLKR